MLRHVCGNESTRPRVVIAVSSYTPQQVEALGGLPDGVALLAKPIRPEPFIAALRAAGLPGDVRDLAAT